MHKNIAYCGLDCLACPAYMATQQGDDKALERIASEWSNGELKFDPVEGNCVGCAEDGQHHSWCEICPVRKCGIDKMVKNCGFCVYYPCEELNKSFEKSKGIKDTLEKIKREL
ncbi:MAG: DUF3795 domain-containing protein [Promethearchaeota archaeon]|jgi:hypothetical protein